MDRSPTITRRTALTAALSALIAPKAFAQSITIIPRTDKSRDVDLSIERLADFERSISLRLRVDPSTRSAEEMLELVSRIDIRDDAGIRISSGIDVSVSHGIVLGHSGGSAEITHVTSTPDGLLVTGLFKDRQGRIVVPPQGSIAAYTTGGQRLCFAQETAVASPHSLPMSFVLLIDRSGSMKDVMRRVEQASRRFLDSLPGRAQCALISFAEDRWSQGFGASDSRSCEASNFAFGGLTASGQTNLYPALEEAYRWLNAPARAQHQRAVILITDGQVNQSTEMKARLESMKGDALTFVYFLGGQEEQWLQGLADNYLSHEGALTPALEGYFSVLSGAYAKQTVLRMRPCGAP